MRVKDPDAFIGGTLETWTTFSQLLGRRIVIYFFLIVRYRADLTVIHEGFIRVGFFGTIAGVLTFISLQQKRAEHTLYESEERFRAMVETSGDWVWEVDRNGIYICRPEGQGR